ncbi:MAG: amidohydrolase family protein [Anaerolineales bacterium]|nr:amidohydrolase family protein [Anaerolineales bacterium]
MTVKIGAKFAVTMTEQGVIADPVIEIEGQRIRHVLADAQDIQPDIYIDGIIIPGLISTHTHLHGLVAYGHPVPAPVGFWPFLKEYWWPFVEDVLRTDDVVSLAEYASILHLKNGYTCFCDVMEAPYAEPGFMLAEAEAIEKTGSRAFVSNEATERAGSEIARKLLQENERLLSLDGLVRGLMSVHTTFSCSSDYIKHAKEIARRNGKLFQMHVSEGTYHVEDTIERFGKRPVNYLKDLGVLDEYTLASQCVHLNDEEIGILAGTGVKVTHNPISNMEIGTGAAPLAKMLAAGIDASLGDDGFVRALDPFVNLSTTLLLHTLMTPGEVSARDVLSLHTDRAARALHIDAGCIAPDKLADLVILRNNSPAPLLTENAIYHLVVGALGTDVSHVIVDGKVVVANGEIKTVDEESARARSAGTISRLWDGARKGLG